MNNFFKAVTSLFTGKDYLVKQTAPNTFEAQGYMPDVESMQIGGSHYLEMRIQPWEVMEAWLTHEEFIGFLNGNIIKYISRYKAKGGVQDLQKARQYLDKLIKVKENEALK
jgi:hypothetical protein